MRTAVRAIILKNNHLLVMHRNKFGKEYHTLPGGNVELHESLEQALMRELDEETQVVIQNPRLVILEHAGDPYGDQYIFLCEYVSGEPSLKHDAEEDQINRLGQNLHTPEWVSVTELEKLPFRSEKLRTEILKALDTTWPDEPIEIRSA